MPKPLLITIGVTVLCGLAADAAWGAPAGVRAAAYVSVMGLVFIALHRNQQDLDEVKDELADRRNGAMRNRVPGSLSNEFGPGGADTSRPAPDSLHRMAATERVLRLEGPELDLIVQGMWRTLLDHTCSVRATARILEEIARARQFGKIDYCLVFQVEARSGDTALDSPEWALHVVHAAP